MVNEGARCTPAHMTEARIRGMAYACAGSDRWVEASLAYACVDDDHVVEASVAGACVGSSHVVEASVATGSRADSQQKSWCRSRPYTSGSRVTERYSLASWHTRANTSRQTRHLARLRAPWF